MARLAGSRAQHDEIKTLSKSIVSDQQREIERMQKLRSSLFGEAMNMDFPGMKVGMSGMDMAKLDSLKANAFDIEFIDQMILHHQRAIAMANDLLSKDQTTK